MSYADVAALARDQRYRDRMQHAVCAAATAIYNEDPTTPNHAARAALAVQILRTPTQALEPFVTICATWIYNTWQAQVPPIMEPTDDMLDQEIKSVWDVIAGAVA